MAWLDPVLSVLFLAAFFAGCVDAVVGGGGLIQIPTLFSMYPAQLPATLFGTNKAASVFGTASAAWRYARRIEMPWAAILPAAAAAFVFSFLGAMAVAWLPKEALRPLMLGLMIFAALHTLFKKEFGAEHRPGPGGRRELLLALLLGSAIGFYDGFFGPGTGSFLIFLFIRYFGFDFLHASASAKVVNVATNLAALAYFVPNGFCLPSVALGMAVFNVLGAQFGTRLAMRFGNAFVRWGFLFMLCVLIGRFAWDTWRGY